MAYYYLTGAIKRRMLRELKMCFEHVFPQHKDIIDHINYKYSFKERPQKGIVITNSGASPMRLSPDNFQGTVISHVMKAQVGRFAGDSLEWVREDAIAVRQNNGYFPSEAGVYYIEVMSDNTLLSAVGQAAFDTILDEVGEHEFYFYVDPLLSISKESILTVTDDLETEATLLNAPALEGTVRLYEDGYPLLTGKALRLEANSISILSGSSADLTFGLPHGDVSVSLITEEGSHLITDNINDILILSINEKPPVTCVLPSGLITPTQVRASILQALQNALIPSNLYAVEVVNDQVKLTATKSIHVDPTSTAASTLGIDTGYVKAELKGYVFNSYLEKNLYLKMEINGAEQDVFFRQGDWTPEQIASHIEESVQEDLSINAFSTGDYTIDEVTGQVTFLKPLEKGCRITADYKYPTESHGPYPARKNQSNNEAIAGCVLAFGQRIADHDKMAVVVTSSREETADEFGGRWETSIDLDIITRDPMTRDEISDLLMIYFFVMRREKLTEEGLELTDMSFGGESEDIYDEASQEYFFNASLSLSIQTDWALHIPKPLKIERVVPISYHKESKEMGLPNSERNYDADLVDASENLGISQASHFYFVGRSRDFERIK